MSDEETRGVDSPGKKKSFFGSLKRGKKKGARSATAEDEGPGAGATGSDGLIESPATDVTPGSTAGAVARSGKCAFFALEVELKDGRDLAARDKTESYHVEFEHDKPFTRTLARSGTSDPYVKFKSDGKQIYKSRTVSKNLNPQWNEKFCVPIEDITVPLVLKVYDFDKVGGDDPMGRATVDLSGIEINKPTEMTLELEDTEESGEKLGAINATFTIEPKNVEDRQEIARRAALAAKKAKDPKDPSKGPTQLWDGLVSIILVEGKKLMPMDDSGFSDPYCRFRLGNEKYKSKACKETLNPYWKEQFDLKMYSDSPMTLEVTVWDRDIRKDEFMGRCQIDLSKLEKEKSHKVEAELEDNAGIVVMHLSITGLDAPGCESDLSAHPDDPERRKALVESFSLKKTPKKIKECGWLQIKLHRAVGLASADIGGLSDPFAVIVLNNQRLVTNTMYKTLNPAWDKIYEMTVWDIHDVLDITVYDEDKRGAPEFLGRVKIPLLQITPQEKRLYQLKNKSLEGRAKGHLILTLDFLFNPIRSAVRTINPRDPQVMYEPPKFKRQLLQRNIDRVNKLVASLVSTGAFVGSLFTWQYKFRSGFAFMIYIFMCFNFDFYIIPLALLLTFLKQYVVCMLLTDRNVNPEDQEGAPQDDDDDDDDEEEEKGKKGDKGKSFKEKIAALTSICSTVQNALDQVASLGERVKNTFNWTVPYCSYLLCVAFTLVTVVLYLVPLKFLLLAFGINKFTKKIRKPNAVDNNEAADFLSRIPSDVEIKETKLLKTDPSLRLRKSDP